MSSFYTFLQKEFVEMIRTKKLFILIGIFALLGMVSPLLTRYMSEILTISMGPTAPIMTLKPVWSDSWIRFYGNLTQMGGIVIILFFMSCVSGEKQNRTIELTLSKNLSPTSFILAKCLAAILSMLVVFILSVLLCYVYTYYLFGYAGELRDITVSAILFFLFIIILICFTVFASTLASSTAISAILSFVAYVLLLLSAYLPKIGYFMPGKLISISTGVFKDEIVTNMIPIVVCTIIIGCMVTFLATKILKYQEI